MSTDRARSEAVRALPAARRNEPGEQAKTGPMRLEPCLPVGGFAGHSGLPGAARGSALVCDADKAIQRRRGERPVAKQQQPGGGALVTAGCQETDSFRRSA
jgi:hypothetical protein